MLILIPMNHANLSKDKSTHFQFRRPSGTMPPVDKDPAWTKSVYLSGKISGLWYPYVWLKFNFYEIYLSFFGYTVWNPIRQLDRKLPYDDLLMTCLEHLHQQDYICFQFDWLWSDEARIEFSEAAKRDKKLIGSGIYTKKFFLFLQEKG